MTKKFEFKDEEVSSTWQVDILMRFLDDKAFKSLWESYKAARLRFSMTSKPPTDLQKKMAEMRKKGNLTSQIAKQFKVPGHVVDAAVKKVAITNYFNS